MTFKVGQPRPEGAGRKLGTKNKTSQAIQEALAEHVEKAYATLLDCLVNADSYAVRLAAAKELFDRTGGRPRQAMALDESGAPMQVIFKTVLEGDDK